jgi:hypothetical protein
MKFSLEPVARLQPAASLFEPAFWHTQANLFGPSVVPSNNTSDILEAQIFS